MIVNRVLKTWYIIYPLMTLTQIAKSMGPTWGPPWSCRPQMGAMLAPWALLSGYVQRHYYEVPWRINKTLRFIWCGYENTFAHKIAIPRAMEAKRTDSITFMVVTFSHRTYMCICIYNVVLWQCHVICYNVTTLWSIVYCGLYSKLIRLMYHCYSFWFLLPSWRPFY